MSLSHQVHGLSKEFLVNCFISGLREAVKLELLAKQLRTVLVEMRLTRLKEDKVALLKLTVTKSSFFPHNTYHSSNTSCSNTTNPTSKGSNSTTPFGQPLDTIEDLGEER